VKKILLIALVLTTLIWSTSEAKKLSYSFDPPQKPWIGETQKDADFSYRNPSLGAGIIISSRCEGNAAEPPLEVLFRHLFIDFENKTVINQQKTELDGKEALTTELEANYGGERFKFLSAITKQSACVYDMLLISPPENFEKVRNDFENILKSFKFK